MHRSHAFVLPVLALVPLLLATPAAAQGATTSASDLRAPKGVWQTVGGGPDRSRSAATRVTRVAPTQRVFGIEPRGDLIGEPLFNDQVLVLETRVEGEEHLVTVYDLANGEEIADRDFEVPDGCFPFLADDLLVLRSALDELTAFRLSTRGMRRVASYDSKVGFVGAPFVVGDDVFVGQGTNLDRLNLRGLRLVETARFPGRDHGSIVSPLHIDRGRYAEGGRLAIGFMASTDGGATARPMVASFDPLRSLEPSCGPRYPVSVAIQFLDPLTQIHPLTVAPYFDGLLFHCAGGLGVHEGQTLVGIGIDGDGDPIAGSVSTDHPPAVRGSSFIGHMSSGTEEGDLLYLIEHRERAETLENEFVSIAGDGFHDTLLLHFRGATWGGDVALFAGRAWHADSGRVLWHVPQLEDAALYPTEHGVVAVRDDGRIESWRSSVLDVDDDRPLVGEDAADSFRGVVITTDGETRSGTFAVREEGVVEVRGSREREIDEAIWFVGELDGTVHYVGAPEAIGPGVDAVVRDLDASDFARYSNAAERSNDPDRIRRAIERGTRLDEELDDLFDALAELRASDRPVSSKQAARFDDYEATFAKRRFDVFVRALASVRTSQPDLDPVHEAAMLALLDRGVGLEDVRRDVEALIPDGLSLPMRADLADWLAFVRSTSAHEIRIVEPPPESDPDMTWEERRLGIATTWSEDVVGFESENLFVISPVDRPGAVATCVALGEHVCSLLEEMFADGANERTVRHRMVIYLYESKEQYLEESSRGDPAAATGLAWTAGHYDPRAGLVRLFLPDGEGDWESAAQTFRHELAHQWMTERCPNLTDEDASSTRMALPGYWIVEGFACLVQDFRIDESEGVVGPLDPRSNLLDIVANVPPDGSIGWDALTAIPHARLMGLLAIEPRPIALTWSLGRVRPVDGMGLFYAQANALASFLYHGDGGRYREAFLDYVVAYYAGSRNLDFEARFGITAEEAGRRAREHARATVTSR